MGTKLTIELSDELAIGLIAMAASKSWTVEQEVLFLIDVALVEYLPPIPLDEFLRDIENLPPPRGKPTRSATENEAD